MTIVPSCWGDDDPDGLLVHAAPPKQMTFARAAPARAGGVSA